MESRSSQNLKKLAKALSHSSWTEAHIRVVLVTQLAHEKIPSWLPPLIRHLHRRHFGGQRPLVREIEESLLSCQPFAKANAKGKVFLTNDGEPSPISFIPGKPEWDLPILTDVLDLAQLLHFHEDDLSWLTSLHRGKSHYHYTIRKKRNGSHRLIEVPKPILKVAQERLHRKLIGKIPPHAKACGFIPGRSVFDFVRPHRNKEFVIKMDLADFFASIQRGRVFRLFFQLGYPEKMAHMLSQLSTNAVSNRFLGSSPLLEEERRFYREAHLPQGAPCSPALANLCAYHLDTRLDGLAKALDLAYTRYSDDLLFSGGTRFARQSKRFHDLVLRIILEEGFEINPRKTRLMAKSQRQSATGLVFNESPNVSRRERDRLKAILTNCVKNGWRSQNRADHPQFQAHLHGRIEWVRQANSVQGEKLRQIFDRIDWS